MGVAPEVIIQDFMLTQTNRQKRNQTKMANYRRFTQDPVVLDHLYALIDTQPEFIQASLAVINAKYQTITNYVQEELGLTTREIQSLRQLYLTEN
ncbi:tyrosine-protein phosphatase [Bombilactobacillus apium]|uniref:tyrosine-protein phosphatase n=1 Tax=Bombilactobacillus apium TaxID=2675299 RepID=UPI001E401608|nr:tyrosine-protein phosphatase [Bombilactobacillus apium]